MSEGRRISAFRGFLDKTNEGKSTLNEIDLNLFDLAVTTEVDEEFEIIPNDSKVVENPPKLIAQFTEGRAETSPAITAREQISVDCTLNQSEKFNKKQTPNQHNLDDKKAHDENRSNNDGWTQYIDDESGLPYWYNEQTGEAKWAEVDKTATQAPIEIQGVWEKYYDDQGNPFYYNTVTGVSDWEIPADAIIATELETNDTKNESPSMKSESVSISLKSALKKGTSIKSIRSARSFGLSRAGSVRFSSFSDKVSIIEDQTSFLTRNPSNESLKSIKAAGSFKLSRVPSVADNLKPVIPVKRKTKNGFQILKEGASILKQQRDSNGVLWIEYQAVDEGPIFYATEDPESGQWGKPDIFDEENCVAVHAACESSQDGPALESINDGWTQYIDDESGLPYWYNEQTGEAKWAEVDKTPTQAPIEIQGVWEKYYDDQGNPFYYNTVTGVSDWEIPADAILSTGIVDNNNDFVTKRASSIKSIRSARSFGLSRIGSSKFASFSEKVVMIDNSAKYERGVSAKSLKSIKSAASFKVTQMPNVADTLKPKVPLKNASKNGFQILKEGASILREQRDSNGVLWTEYQAVNGGPVFYATEDPQSGQWGKPEVFDLLESPRNNKQRDINGSISPSDSSLSASNDLVLDFFTLDNDAALKIISPALARLPSFEPQPQGTPIAMLAEKISMKEECSIPIKPDESHGNCAISPLKDNWSKPPLGSTPRTLEVTPRNISPRKPLQVPIIDKIDIPISNGSPSNNLDHLEILDVSYDGTNIDLIPKDTISRESMEVSFRDQTKNEKAIVENKILVDMEQRLNFHRDKPTEKPISISSGSSVDSKSPDGFVMKGTIDIHTAFGSNSGSLVEDLYRNEFESVAIANSGEEVCNIQNGNMEERLLTPDAPIANTPTNSKDTLDLPPLVPNRADAFPNNGISDDKVESAVPSSDSVEAQNGASAPLQSHSSITLDSDSVAGTNGLNTINLAIQRIQEEAMLELQSLRSNLENAKQEFSSVSAIMSMSPTTLDQMILHENHIHHQSYSDKIFNDGLKVGSNSSVEDGPKPDVMIESQCLDEDPVVKPVETANILSLHHIISEIPSSACESVEVVSLDKVLTKENPHADSLFSVDHNSLEIPSSACENVQVVTLDKVLTKENPHDDSLFSLDEYIFSPVKPKQQLNDLSAESDWTGIVKRSQILDNQENWTCYFDFETSTKFYRNNISGICQLQVPQYEKTSPTSTDNIAKEEACLDEVNKLKKVEHPFAIVAVEEPGSTIVAIDPPAVIDNLQIVDGEVMMNDEFLPLDIQSSAPHLSDSSEINNSVMEANSDKVEDKIESTLPNIFIPSLPNKDQLVKNLAKIERSSASLFHSQLHHDYQNQDAESKLLLKRLQALNTMSRTNSTPPVPNVSALDSDGLKRLQNKSRAILERCCALLDRIEISNVENTISERQLLRAAVYQRNSLHANLRDFKHDGPLHTYTPHVFYFPSSSAFKNYWKTRKPKVQIGEWSCYGGVQGVFELENNKHRRKRIDNNFQIYHHSAEKISQIGEPFDMAFKSRACNLKREEWSEFVVNSLVSQKTLEHLGVEFLQDEYGGYLFYCPIRKSYSSSGIFDEKSMSMSMATKLSNNRIDSPQGGGSHHIWDKKIASKKVDRLMKSKASGYSPKRIVSGNVWERFPDLRENFADDIDQSTFFLTAEQQMQTSSSAVEFSLRSLNLLPDSDPKLQIQRSFDIYRSTFDELQKTSKLFSLSQLPSEQESVLPESQEYCKGADHWNILHDAFGMAEHDFNQKSGSSTAGDSEEKDDVHFGPMTEFVKIFGMLKFEEQMDSDSYKRYETIITTIAQADSENPIPVLELVEFFLYQGLGKPALAVLKQGIDIMLCSPIYNEMPQSFEFALARILSIKMSQKYFGYFESYASILELLHMFGGGSGSNPSFVMSSMASYLKDLQHFEWSESLLIGALLANNGNDLALLRYAQLLARKGDFRGSLKYLHRITASNSGSMNDKKNNNSQLQVIARIAQLEEAWLMDLFQCNSNDHEAIILGYKAVFQSYHGDRIQSIALHSLAAFFMAQQSPRNQTAEYLQRSIQCDSDNALAFFLYSSLSIVFQSERKIFSSVQKKKECNIKVVGNKLTPPSVTELASNVDGSEQIDDNPRNFCTLDQIDAHMRRGLVLMPYVEFRWISILSYADFIHLSLRDLKRAKDYYEEAMKISFSKEISPILANVHFYQYSLNDYQSCNSILIRAMRSRHGNIPITSLIDFDSFHQAQFPDQTILDNMDEEEKMIFSMGPSSSPIRTSTNQIFQNYKSLVGTEEEYQKSLVPIQDRLDCISLYTAVGYYLWDKSSNFGDDETLSAAKKYAMRALKLQRNYSPALRLIGLISFFEASNPVNKRVGAKYIAAACNSVLSTSQENSFHRSSGDSFDVPLEKSRCSLQNSLLNASAIKTNGLMKVYWSHFDQGITLLEKAISISPTCATSHRSLGMIYYLYKNNVVKAMSHLTIAYDLSCQEDIEVLRLKSQILMDQKDYVEARLLLQEVIRKSPYDPISFVNLAWCAYYINKSNPLADKTIFDRPVGNSMSYQESSDSEFFGFHDSHMYSRDHLVGIDEIGLSMDSGTNMKRRLNVLNPNTLSPSILGKLSYSNDCDELLHVSRTLITFLTDGGQRSYSDGLLDTAFEKLDATKNGMDHSEKNAIAGSPFDSCIPGYIGASYIYFWTGFFYFQSGKRLHVGRPIDQDFQRNSHYNSTEEAMSTAVSFFSISRDIHKATLRWTENEEHISSDNYPSEKKCQMTETAKRHSKKIRSQNALYAAMSLYYLGIIHEQGEDLNSAEHCYEEAVSIASSNLNQNPIILLRVIRHIESALVSAKDYLGRLNRREHGLKKLKRKKKKSNGSIKNKSVGVSATDRREIDGDTSGINYKALLDSSSTRNGIAEIDDVIPGSHQNESYSDANPVGGLGHFFTPKRNLFDDLNGFNRRYKIDTKVDKGVDKFDSSVLNLHSASQLGDNKISPRVVSDKKNDGREDVDEFIDPYEEEEESGELNLSHLQKSLEGGSPSKPKQLSPEMVMLVKKVLMHQRILELALVKKFSSEKVLKDLAKVEVPKKSFVHVDPDWIEKSLYSCGKCEDWSTLMLSMRDCYL